MRVLILGGTSEARALARHLLASAEFGQVGGLHVISSLAGRVSAPALPVGEVRIGGFGGPDGMRHWLAEQDIDAVVDATHPYATTISASAATVCTELAVPLAVLSRPAWTPQPGDNWRMADTMSDAAQWLRSQQDPLRVLLTVGRQELAPFAADDRHWFLIRSIEQPDTELPAHHELLFDRGPFNVDGELQLLRERAIDLVVTKNSGGTLTAAKLSAARELGVPVLMIERPRSTLQSVTVERFDDSAAVTNWLVAVSSDRGIAGA